MIWQCFNMTSFKVNREAKLGCIELYKILRFFKDWKEGK